MNGVSKTLIKLRPVEEIIDPPDEYEEKLLDLIEKAYRSNNRKLFKKLAKLYDKAVYKYHMDFEKAYREALELLNK